MAKKTTVAAKKSSVSAKSKQRTSIISKVQNHSFGVSRAYLFEYGLLLLSVGALVGLFTTMAREISVSLASAEVADGFEAASNFSDAVLTLSAMLVVLPLAVVLTQRTAAAERVNSAVKNIGWRKGFLGIFLATTSISAIISAIYWMNTVLAYLTGAENSFAWATFLGMGVTALTLFAVVAAFANDYRSLPSVASARMMHRTRYGLVLLSLIAASLFIMLPMTDYRDATEVSNSSRYGSTECNEGSYGDYRFKDDSYSDDQVRPLPLEEY